MIVVTDELRDATGDHAWVGAMLDVEAALAEVEASLGIIPDAAAAAIRQATKDRSRFDPAEIGRAARGGGNPVIPLVVALREAAGDAGDWVHWGATSQDVLDTATMLVCARSLPIITTSLDELAQGCATLAGEHRGTLMVGRTLLQPAAPITFGFKAAGWLQGVLDARRHLGTARGELAVQLGGAVGTAAALGANGPAVARALARRLELAEPAMAWHTARQRVALLGGALAMAAGTAAKIALDVALLMQFEVGEAAEPGAAARGGSSTLPHKRNPSGAAAVISAARQAHALVAVLYGSLIAEHERAVGGWQAEWEALSELLALSGGGVARTVEIVCELEVRPEAMAANLEATCGATLSERVVAALAPSMGRDQAMTVVAEAAQRARLAGTAFAQEVAPLLPAGELGRLLDPAGYLGASDA
ncbi:MAG: 3-carboxy-cis,cis-muconate cycloisomerase, partial [Acidimicrobiales bacterium]